MYMYEELESKPARSNVAVRMQVTAYYRLRSEQEVFVIQYVLAYDTARHL